MGGGGKWMGGGNRNNFKVAILYLFMGESIRAGECESPRELSDSLFLLRKSSSSCTSSIQVDFASTCDPSSTTPTKTLPAFHRDRCFFTPAFVLPSDQVLPCSLSRATPTTASCTVTCTSGRLRRWRNKKRI